MADNTDKSSSIYPWTDAIKSLYNMGMGIANNIQQQKWNKQQQKNWETQFEYTKWLNQEMMRREDTAIQRSVADHQAAGFNKLLALGQPAQAGSLTSFTGNAGGSAPQFEASITNPIEAALKMKQLNADTQLTEEQAKLVNEQAKTEEDRRNLYKSMEILNKAQRVKTNREAEILMVDYLRTMHDYKLETDYGIKSNDSGQINNAWQLGYRTLIMSLNAGGTDVHEVMRGILKFLGLTKEQIFSTQKMTQEELADFVAKEYAKQKDVMKSYGGTY